jgi:hypothetical protein
MSFVCEECEREFKTKQNLQKHYERQACKILSFFCRYCNKGFTTDSSMYRHIRLHCDVKKEEDKKKADIYERLVKLEEENKKLHEKMSQNEKEITYSKNENKKLKIKVTTMEKMVNVVKKKRPVVSRAQTLVLKEQPVTKNINKGNIHNGDVNNNVTANIFLTGYGKEDLSKLDKSEMLKIFQNGFNSAIKLTEFIHFNPKYPEYHNIYISNMKDKYAMMFDGKNWNLKMKDDVINMIYDDKRNYIEENLEEFIDSLSVSRRNALERWLATEDDDEKISRIKNEIKLLLYNKRGIVLDTHHKIDKGRTANANLNAKHSKKSKKIAKDDIDGKN